MKNEKNVNYGNWTSTQKDETLPIPEGQNYSNEPESIDENYDNTLNKQNDEMSQISNSEIEDEISNSEIETDEMNGYGATEHNSHNGGVQDCHGGVQDCHTSGARNCHNGGAEGVQDCHSSDTKDCK